MTKRLAVLLAIKALLETALGPDIIVLGLENEGAAPDRIPDGGRVVIRAGDPGEPAIDLSPVTYNYEHQIPVEVTARQSGDRSVSAEAAVDAIVELISAAIASNRTAGGAVDWLDGFSPATDDLFVPGSELAHGAALVLIATYSTTNPL